MMIGGNPYFMQFFCFYQHTYWFQLSMQSLFMGIGWPQIFPLLHNLAHRIWNEVQHDIHFGIDSSIPPRVHPVVFFVICSVIWMYARLLLVWRKVHCHILLPVFIAREMPYASGKGTFQQWKYSSKLDCVGYQLIVFENFDAFDQFFFSLPAVWCALQTMCK